MRVLVTGYEDGDLEKVLLAMRSLPYDQLVIVGQGDLSTSKEVKMIAGLEDMAGKEVVLEAIGESDFMAMVDAFTDVLRRCSNDGGSGRRNRVMLNISGGSKLLGDASLFAAFRLGVEAYHCDRAVTKLPIMSDVMPTSVFTETQMRFLCTLCEEWLTLDQVIAKSQPPSRQAGERVLRELRKFGLLRTKVDQGRILLALSDAGAEAKRMVRIART